MFLSSDEACSLPWMEHFLIIGTTDVTHHDAPDDVKCSADEPDYLLRCFDEFFDPGVSEEDVLWSYAGVRPLVGDGNENPGKLTRGYMQRKQKMLERRKIFVSSN